MRLLNTVVSLLLIMLMSACNTMPKPAADGKQDLIYKFETLKHLSNFGFIDPDDISLIGKLSNNLGKTNIEGVNEYRRWWCTQLSANELLGYVNKISRKDCADMQGTWDGKWCRSKEDKPLFFVDAGNLEYFRDPNNGHLPYCTASRAFSVVASTSDKSQPEAWLARAQNTYGYKTQIEIANAAKIAQEKQEQSEQRKRIEQNYNAMQIESRGVGSRVCKEVRAYTYTGIIEQINADKIKVSVQEKVIGNFKDNRFSPTVIWDKTTNWTACDSKDERELMGR